MSAAVDALLARIRAAETRLVEHAAAEDRGLPSGLTEPDPGAEERWEAGQVWAHVAEFPAYWLAQIRLVLGARAEGAPEPIAFGRTKADPHRIAAIERDRSTDPSALLERVRQALAEASDTLSALPDEAWTVRGAHPTLGEMPVSRIAERFIAEHLEEHADQLDLLRSVVHRP